MARMTRDDWFAVAADQLTHRGEAGLTLNALTTAAGVTQGSYYHHFGGQSGFIDAFLDYLSQRAFVDVSAMPGIDASTAEGAREALRRLVELIASEDLALEAAIRRWAQSDARVAALVSTIDTQRHALLQRLFLAATGDAGRADYLSRLNGAFYLGAVHSVPPIQGEEYARMAADLGRLLEEDS